MHGVSKNGPVYLSEFRANTLVGLWGVGENGRSISTISPPTDRTGRAAGYPKIKKRKKKGEEEGKTRGGDIEGRATRGEGGERGTLHRRLTKKNERASCGGGKRRRLE